MSMCTYATLLICFLTPVAILPMGIKWFMIIEVFFYTFVIPLLMIWILYKLKVVEHWALRNRKDRSIPLFVNFIAYVVCSLSLYRHEILPTWAMCTYYGSTVVALVAWIVSFWWKISGHALALSGLTVVSWLYYFMFKGAFMPLFFPFLLIILLGLLCSIRVYLGRHTLAQVYAGSAVGIALMYATFQIVL